MSVQLIVWAYEQKVGSPTRKAVLLALANRANHDTGKCCPSVARISEETELGERAIRQALKDLCDEGFIARTRRRRGDGSLAGYDYLFQVANPASLPAADAASPPAADAAQEPEEDLEPEERLAVSPQNGTPRKRNPVWDALTEVFGEATTATAKTRRGKVCKSLTAARASPEDVLRRARSWPRHFDDATLTDTALEKHWDTLGREPLRATRS